MARLVRTFSAFARGIGLARDGKERPLQSQSGTCSLPFASCIFTNNRPEAEKRMAIALPSWSALVQGRRLAHTAILVLGVGINIVDSFMLAAILPSVVRGTARAPRRVRRADRGGDGSLLRAYRKLDDVLGAGGRGGRDGLVAPHDGVLGAWLRRGDRGSGRQCGRPGRRCLDGDGGDGRDVGLWARHRRAGRGRDALPPAARVTPGFTACP